MNSFDVLRSGRQFDLPSASPPENNKLNSSCSDSEETAEANEQHVRTKQTWDDAAHSWAQIVNTRLSWENMRERYGQVVQEKIDAAQEKIDAAQEKIDAVIDAAQEKVETLQNIPSPIGGYCCGGHRKPDRESLVDDKASLDECGDHF